MEGAGDDEAGGGDIVTDDELRILRSERQNLAFFFRAELPGGVIRLFAGAGDYPVQPDAVETEGGIYLSAGTLGGGLPDVDHLINAQAQGINLTLSGANIETVRAYLRERSTIIGAPAAFGWGVLDERYRPAGPIRWPVRGVLSQPRLARQKAGPGVWKRELTITLISGAYARRRGVHRYLVSTDQRREHPTDAFCDRSGIYSQQTTRPWPN